MGSVGFRHDTFLYGDDAEFAAGMGAFVREAIANEDDIFVLLNHAKTDLLRDELGAEGDAVLFGDMERVGRNPARIIPEWQAFVDRGPPRNMRGIGEPVWAGRSEDEIAECHLHEALLNVAFGDAPSFFLVCPYDSKTLPPAVLDAARATHGGSRDIGDVLAQSLTPPDAPVSVLHITEPSLFDLRTVVAAHATEAGLTSHRISDLVLAVSELASNSISYGGGHGTLTSWVRPDAVVYEVHDAGIVTDPLIGRVMPSPHQHGGRGLWLVNQLCDLVQLRSTAAGTNVRVSMRLDLT